MSRPALLELTDETADSLRNDYLTLAGRASLIFITDQRSLDDAVAFVLELKRGEKRVVEEFRPLKKSANHAHAVLCEAEKKYLAPIRLAADIMDDSIKKYMHVHRVAAELSDGVIAPLGKMRGVGESEIWKFEITDAAAIPREFLMPDEKKITGVVKAMRGETKIPGIRIYPEIKLIKRTA